MRLIKHVRGNAIAYVALFAALSGGAYAATLKRNSVGAKQIRTGAVKTRELAANAVTSAKIGPGQVGTSDLASGAKSMFATVDAVGSGTTAPTLAQSGGVSVRRDSAGNYLVRFPQTLVGRGLIATVHDPTNGTFVAQARRCGTAPTELTACTGGVDPSFEGPNTAYVRVADAESPGVVDVNFTLVAIK